MVNTILILLGVILILILVVYLLFKNRSKLKVELIETVDEYEKELAIKDSKIKDIQKYVETLEKYNVKMDENSRDKAKLLEDIVYNKEKTDAEKDNNIAALIASLDN